MEEGPCFLCFHFKSILTVLPFPLAQSARVGAVPRYHSNSKSDLQRRILVLDANTTARFLVAKTG